MEGEQPYLGDLLTMVINHLLPDDPPSLGSVSTLATYETLGPVGCFKVEVTRRMARRCYAFLGFGWRIRKEFWDSVYVDNSLLIISCYIWIWTFIFHQEYVATCCKMPWISSSFHHFCCIKKWREISVQNVVGAITGNSCNLGGRPKAWRRSAGLGLPERKAALPEN